MKLTQKELILGYYKKYPLREIKHEEVVPWAMEEWYRITKSPFRDPDRAIRSLHQEGHLVKLERGLYKYDPNDVMLRDLEDFSATDKEKILKKYNYKCVICGRGKNEGIALAVDHIKPKDKGGQAILSNGQVLCSPHNNQKKNYSQFEMGKKFFIAYRNQAIALGDKNMINFCESIFNVYEEFNIDSHIKEENKIPKRKRKRKS